jgi:hypothetical protein
MLTEKIIGYAGTEPRSGKLKLIAGVFDKSISQFGLKISPTSILITGKDVSK